MTTFTSDSASSISSSISGSCSTKILANIEITAPLTALDGDGTLHLGRLDIASTTIMDIKTLICRRCSRVTTTLPTIFPSIGPSPVFTSTATSTMGTLAEVDGIPEEEILDTDNDNREGEVVRQPMVINGENHRQHNYQGTDSTLTFQNIRLWWRGYLLDDNDLSVARACSGVNPGETAMEYLKGPSCTASSSHTNTSVTTMSSASDRELSQNYNRNSDNHYDTTKLVLFMTTDGMKDREITHHQHTNADFGSPSLRDDIRRRAMLLSQGSFDVEYWRNELRQTSQRWTSGGEVMKRNCVVM